MISDAAVDGARALQDIERQCAFGPRVPGTAAHSGCRQWIRGRLLEEGLTPWEQRFEAPLELLGTRAEAWNLWGLPRPLDEMDAGGEPLLVLGAHWDTRPLADADGPAGGGSPFLGANDGASGVALALGLARALGAAGRGDSVVIALFDAEDAGDDRNPDSYCLGSRHAASALPGFFRRVLLGINLDMVGARGLRLSRERYSVRLAPGPTGRLWALGMELAPELFAAGEIGPITDDHLPFLRAGVPFICLVGHPYPHWHRASDTPEQCDASVLSRLGAVLLRFALAELDRAR